MSKGGPYQSFEITVDNAGKIEKTNVERITFQEAVRDAYHIVAQSSFSKKIMSVRVVN